jgi:hypothetical protein
MTDEDDNSPDLMDLSEIKTDIAQTVQTDIIRPSVFSQNFCRFTLDRRLGFLHSDSKITLSVTPAAGNTSAYYPLNIGVGSLISSCALKIGQRTISETQDFAHLHAYSSLFLTNENNLEREQYLSQRGIAHKNVYADTTNPLSASTYGLDNGKNADGVANTLNAFQINSAASADTIAEAPTYSIYLSDLFSCLQSFQIPSYLINDPIFVEINWTPVSTSLSGAQVSARMCMASTDVEDTEYDINENEVNLIYDSVSYDADVMQKYAEGKGRNIVFEFKDYS